MPSSLRAAPISPELASAVRQQLHRLLQASGLQTAPRQQRLLRHIVEATLAGEADRLKGYTIGVEVFDRGADFDPNTDPIVRVEIGRLRSKLLAHYCGEGSDDPVLIEIPKGGNAATFERRLQRSAYPSAVPRSPSDSRPRIAVIPFTNLSDEPGHDLLADAIAEDLVTELSKLSGLFVVSRHASFAYRELTESPVAVATALGVSCLVEGSVRSSGRTLRVTVRLVNAEKGTTIWGERYDRLHLERFDIQDNVTQEIVRALSVHLTPLEAARLAETPTSSAEARNLVQQGIGHFWKYTPVDLVAAETAFSKAVELDPEYAAAHAWLGAAAIVRHAFAFDRTDASAARAQQHVRLALAIDPLLAWAHAIDCHVKDWALRRHELAIAAGRRAVALDPNSSDSHTVLAYALAAGQQHEEALAMAEIAMQLNPRPTGYTYTAKAMALRFAGRLEEAAATFRLGIDAHPDFPGNVMGFASCLLEAGKEQEAKSWIESYRARTGGDLVFRNRHSNPTLRLRQSEAMRRLGFVELP